MSRVATTSHAVRSASCVAALVCTLAIAPAAYAQACCAGTGAVTPGRLALHESALVGTIVKASSVLGSFDTQGAYVASTAGAGELDFEQDLFGAYRVVDRGQLALLVPLVETQRKSRGARELGGGVGDVNLSARYDFTLAGASRYVPGIALLAGVTAPTGKPPDASGIGALATGATGIGAFQLNGGLAVAQAFGPWLVNASGIFAQRTARTVGSGDTAIHERLGSQWTALAAVAYTSPSEVSAALSASYTLEGDATINGVDAASTSHRLPALTLSAAVPLSDRWRVQTSIFDNLPIPQLGMNQPATAGTSITVVHSWF